MLSDAFNTLLFDDSGQAMTEYALIIALVAVGLILVLVLFRDAIGDVFTAITGELNDATVDQYGG